MFHGEGVGARRGREQQAARDATRFAWVPVPVFILLVIVLYALDSGAPFMSRWLLLAFNLTFITAVSLLVTWLASRSYLEDGSVAVLAVALASLAFGEGNALAACAGLLRLSSDHMTAPHNLGAFVAGLCFLGSTLLTARPDWHQPAWPRRTVLAAGLLLVTAGLAGVFLGKANGWNHLVFQTSTGPTLLRQVVLGSAVVMFTFAALLNWVLHTGASGSFVSWYSLALLLVAVGLAGVFLPQQVTSMTSWAGRAAQYVGCGYLLIAMQADRSAVFPIVRLLRETRDRYRRLVQLSPEAILVHSDERILFANPAAARLLGAPTPEDLLDRPVLDLAHPDCHDRVMERIALAKTGVPTSLREMSVRRLDGTRVPVETISAAVEFRGEPAVQVIMRDITERKRAEEKVREATQEAERRANEAAEGKRILDEQAAKLAEANRLKDEFLATLSHEVRTPLNAILGWSHMLVRGVLNADDTQRAIDAIHRNAAAQLRLIDDVLDVSRIVSGKLRLDTVRVDIAACVQNALAAVRPAAAARQIEIVERLDEAAVVLGDSDRFQQVFWNLLSNAVKFTEPGGRVTVSLGRTDGEVLVRVEDTGIGIPLDFLPRVFERFSQADGSPTRAHGGLGLGLAIVRHLVELHGGRVTAESEGPGRGAAFTVWLPALPPEERVTDWLARSEFGARVDEGEATRLSGLKVLVVDDELDARDLLATVLRKHGAEVKASSDSREALEQVMAWRPDVLLSDIGMPGVDGYQLVRQLRALPPETGGATPAIAVTAYGRAQDRAQALAEGYFEHLPKPVVPAQLVAMVAAATRSGGRVV